MILLIDEKEYKFKITERALENIEEALGTSIMSLISVQKGMLPVRAIKTIIGASLSNAEGGRIPPTQGYELASNLLKVEGYEKTIEIIAERMQEDLPFLFR